MKKIKYEKVRKIRRELGYSAKDMVEKANPLRIKKDMKPLSAITYYKKETGEVPFFLDEIEIFASVLGKSYKIFFDK